MPDPFGPPAPPPPPPPAAAPGPAGIPVWQTPTAADDRASRTRALAVAALLFFVVAGALAAVLLIPTPNRVPYVVSVPIPAFGSDVPPNPAALRDMDLFLACFPADGREDARGSQERAKFRDRLAGLAAGRAVEANLDLNRPFVFHLSAYGAVRGGEVYILPSDADPDEPATWVKLEELLEALKAYQAQNKLLVLDLARPRADAFTGPSADEVSAALDARLARGPLPCPVLAACGPGEVSHVMPATGTTAFAYYLAEGLRGKADGYGPGTAAVGAKDGKIHVRELAGFVAPRVARWAQLNAAAAQTPKLYDGGLDDGLLLTNYAPAGPAAPIPPPAYPAAVAAAWKRRDDAAGAGAAPTAALARWESLLARAEAAAAAGDADRAAKALADAARFETLAAAPPPAGVRYASAPPAGPAAKAVQDAFAALAAAPPEKRAEARAAVLNLKSSAGEVVRGVWDWLLSDAVEPTPADVVRAADVIDAKLKGTVEFYVEGVAVRRAAGLADPAFTAANWKPVKAFFRAEDAAARVLARGPAGFRHAAARLTAADDARLAAERLLFAADTRKGSQAAEEALDRAAADYRAAGEFLAAFAAAAAAATDALHTLSATAATAAECDTPPAETWHDLAAAAAALADEVYRRPDLDRPPDAAALVRLTATAKQLTDAAKEPFIGLPRTGADAWPAAEFLRHRRLMASPRIPAGDRKKVWDEIAKAADRFHQLCLTEYDEKDDAAGVRTTPTPEKFLPDAAAAARRVRVSAGLLRAAGLPAGPAEDAGKAWRDGLPGFIRTAAGNGNDESAGRAARVFPAGLRPPPQVPGDGLDAADRSAGADAAAYARWLAGHYRKYATARTGVPAAAASYRAEAAKADAAADK